MAMLRVALAVLAMASVLTACETPTVPSYPPIRFTDVEPYKLDVAKVEVLNTYLPPLKAPNVEHDFPYTPAAAAEQWARDRLVAVGTKGVARVIISDASVVETQLKKSKGLKGVFTVDQSERYDGTLTVTVEVRSVEARRDAFVAATARKTNSVPENASLNQREDVYYKMTKELIRSVDATLAREIATYFKRWLK